MLNTAGICRAERGLALFVQRRVAKRQNIEHNGEVKTQRGICRDEFRKDIIKKTTRNQLFLSFVPAKLNKKETGEV